VSGHERDPRTYESRLVAEPTCPSCSPSAVRPTQSDGRGVRLCRGVQEPRPERCDQEFARLDDGHAGLVAGRFLPLRRTVHLDGLAPCRHQPHRRRARRRVRPATPRVPQQLAGQREPRQGAPALMADQAEIRPENLLGGPDDPRRHRLARVDGLRDVRFRRRAQGGVGAQRVDLLGPGGQMAGGRAPHRQTRSSAAARRRANGSDLRQSGRSER
jgi:hypothetical protein